MFCCWRVPALQSFMIRYFTSNPTSSEFSVSDLSVPNCLLFLTLTSVTHCVLLFQKRSVRPWSSRPSATSLSSTWQPTCMSSGASPPAPSPCWVKSSSLPSTCLQVHARLLVYNCFLDLSTDWSVSSVHVGVISSFFSYVCKIATGRFGPSLGAVSTNVWIDCADLRVAASGM